MSVAHTGKVYREDHGEETYDSSIPKLLPFLLSLCFFLSPLFPLLLPATAHLPFAVDLFTVAGEEEGGERK